MAAFNHHEHIPWQPGPMTAALERLITDPSLGIARVAYDPAHAVVVGYGLATFGYDLEFAGRDAFITEIFVAPELRGQRIGRLLLDALGSGVKAAGARAVHLMVRPENTEARTLYEARGFRDVQRLVMTRVLDE